MNAIYDLQREVAEYGQHTPETWDKMMHKVPGVGVVNREKYIINASRNKIVLDIGCTGPLSEALRRITKEYHGIDIVDSPGFAHYYKVDLDKAVNPPYIKDLQLIIAGEVIEHLSNAGHFLDLIRRYNCPVILTTPNAQTNAGKSWLKKGIEHVNKDHVAWYSYHTLRTLVERHGFIVKDWYWYRGVPMFAEGLIFYME